MPSQNGLNHPQSRNRSQEMTRVFDPSAKKTEDILIRNYDHQRGFDLHLVVTHTDETAFQKRYYLQPGETISECDLLPSAQYEVTVTLDDTQEASEHCRIDQSLDHTVVIEIGNRALSLTEGLCF